MSSPLAATSVATRIGAAPDRKSRKVASRSRWSLSPCMAEQPICLDIARESASHDFFVEQKIRTCG